MSLCWGVPQLCSSLQSWKGIVPTSTPLLCLQQPKPRDLSLVEDTQDHFLVFPLSRAAGEGEQAPGRDKETSTPLCPSIPPTLPRTLITQVSEPQPALVCPTRCPQHGAVTSHLYPHDGEVWHGWVVEVDVGIELALRCREDLGAAGCWCVVEHLTQGEHIDELGCEPGTYRVVRACHHLHTVCGDGAAPSAQP